MSHPVPPSAELRSQVLSTLLPGFVGTTLPDWLAALLREGLGGVCVFGVNVEGTEQLARLTAQIRTANPFAVIAIDEEGGDVTRLYYDRGAPYPGNALLGRIDDLELTARTAEAIGMQLREVGCNVTFAPDVDINSNPDNPVIGIRSFGTEPAAVAAHSAAWVRGIQSTGVAVSAKHFPGHGDTAQDSHLALPVVDRSLAELRERELVPFVAAVEAGAKTIMTSHILLPQLDAENPATMSPAILQGLLRGELGFDGVIVSDALDMKGASGVHGIPEAAVRALHAGVDLLCIGTENTGPQLEEITAAVLAAIEAGRLGAERVADASTRVRALAAALAAEAAAAPLPAGSVPEPRYEPEELIAGFDVQPFAAEWRAAAAGSYDLVRIESANNIAVGAAPWGPFAAGASAQLTVAETEEGARVPLIPGRSYVVVGKDLHRRPVARELIDAARAAAPGRVLVVDMGWPGDDRRYADVATFGASRLVGGALLRYLEGIS